METFQPHSDRPEPEIVEINFFGSTLQIPRREYEAGVRLASLTHDSVMFHEILDATTSMQEAYLPDEFRQLLSRAILFTAGDAQQIRSHFQNYYDQDDQLSAADIARLARVGSMELSVSDALTFLPNVPLQVGKIIASVEDCALVHFNLRRKGPATELDAFMGDHKLAGIRFSALRFFSTYFDSLPDR